MSNKNVSDLAVGDVFRSILSPRRWKLEVAPSGSAPAVARAIDEPVRRDRKAFLPGGTNEVERGECDLWGPCALVEVLP